MKDKKGKIKGYWSWWWKETSDDCWFIGVLVGLIALIVVIAICSIYYFRFIYDNYLHLGVSALFLFCVAPYIIVLVMWYFLHSYLVFKDEMKKKKEGKCDTTMM